MTLSRRDWNQLAKEHALCDDQERMKRHVSPWQDFERREMDMLSNESCCTLTLEDLENELVRLEKRLFEIQLLEDEQQIFHVGEHKE